MKIALVILHADPARGGAERYTVDLAAALRRRGHETTLLATRFGEKVGRDEDVLLRVRGATRVGRYEQFLDQLDSYLAEHAFDIVHAMLPVRRCDVYHPHAGLAVEAIASADVKYEGAARRTIARAARRFNRRRLRFAAVERELLTSNEPPVVLCLSEYIKSVVRKHYSLPEAKLATLFNAVDLAKFDPASRRGAGDEARRRLQIAPDNIVALIIAQDFARKGLRQAIVATAKVDDPRLVLVVAGKQDPAAYRRLAQEHGVADRVIFAGPTDDPYAFYRAADFFVLPTRHDPCSLVVLEALAMGLPVISTVFNGACEIMTDAQHGYVLNDPADTDALASAMRHVLDPSLRQSLSAACLQLRPALSHDHHLDQLRQIYQLAHRPR
ncbi:MAG TPA: glycosyltransferase family 4 protein [Tepidisphaeraceae bacterium]|nr:glycosyltransferase family 4 protein [Tepidisphaeraceae bacterium]